MQRSEGEVQLDDEVISTLLASCMGWKPSKTEGEIPSWETSSGKHLCTQAKWLPTLNVVQTFQVLEFLNKNGFLIGINQIVSSDYVVNVTFVKGTKRFVNCFRGSDLPRLICKAALAILNQKNMV